MEPTLAELRGVVYRGDDPVAVELMLTSDPWLAKASDVRGHTALWWACRLGRRRVAHVLYRYGADPRIRSASGQSCLVAATAGDHGEMVDWVIERAGEQCVEERSGAGYTALWWACFDGRDRAARALLSWGADHRARDVNGTACAEIARSRGWKDIEALLHDSDRCYMLKKLRYLWGNGHVQVAGGGSSPLPEGMGLRCDGADHSSITSSSTRTPAAAPSLPTTPPLQPPLCIPTTRSGRLYVTAAHLREPLGPTHPHARPHTPPVCASTTHAHPYAHTHAVCSSTTGVKAPCGASAAGGVLVGGVMEMVATHLPDDVFVELLFYLPGCQKSVQSCVTTC